MLILFESAVGYCLFKVLDETKLQNVDNIYKEFMTKEKRDAFIQLKKFKAFKNTDDAVEAVKCVEQGMYILLLLFIIIIIIINIFAY